MKINATSFSFIGKRKNNEDALYPLAEVLSKQSNLFMVCDGVGGQDKGEVASELVCKRFPLHIFNIAEEKVTAEDLRLSLKAVEEDFEQYIDAKPECKGMGSTLTLVLFQKLEVLFAWAGDSRIYHIRNGQILFQSKDHSVVNDLIDKGEIEPEEAKTHPQRNRILRVVKGSKSPTKLAIEICQEIKPQDFFFLCSDGVLENLTNSHIAELFIDAHSLEYIKECILKICGTSTRDNYTAYLLQIDAEKIVEQNSPTKAKAPSKSFVTNKPDINYKKNNIFLYIVLLILFLSILIAIIVYKYQACK